MSGRLAGNIIAIVITSHATVHQLGWLAVPAAIRRHFCAQNVFDLDCALRLAVLGID